MDKWGNKVRGGHAKGVIHGSHVGLEHYSLKRWLRSISHTKVTLLHLELKHYHVGPIGKGQIVRVNILLGRE